MTQRYGPDFIGVGMERCGTSWLYRMLAHHPDIWVPPLKELHYFDCVDPHLHNQSPRYIRHLPSRIKHRAAHLRHYGDRPELYKNGVLDYMSWDAAYFSRRKSDAWYAGLFHPRFTKGRTAGEITPAYAALSEDSIQRMLGVFPNVKILLVLRHPFYRLRSGLIHHFKVEKNRPFAKVTESEMLDYILREDVQRKSGCSDILEKWSRHVSAYRLFVAPENTFSADFVRDVYTFLDVDAGYHPGAEVIRSRINKHSLLLDEASIPESVCAAIRDFSAQEVARVRAIRPGIADIWQQGKTPNTADGG
jgi:hypothetical protein